MTPDQRPDYTQDHDIVIAAERAYIHERRKNYGQQREGDQPEHLEDLWGLAISGGGIRSATMGLGMIQKFISEGIFKKFDYMSTVSGGGYIGSCLSSLMNNPPDTFVSPGRYLGKTEVGEAPGLDPENSPFVLLMETTPETEVTPDPPKTRSRWVPSQFEPEMQTSEEAAKSSHPEQLVLGYKPATETKVDVRHQIHHLRTHGDYLTPNKRVFGPDIQRAVGVVFAGILHNLLLFGLALTAMVATHYIVFDVVSGGAFFEQFDALNENKAEENGGDAKKQLTSVLTDNVGHFFTSIQDTVSGKSGVAITLFLAGVLLSVVFAFRTRQVVRVGKRLQKKIEKGAIDPPGLSGFSLENYLEGGFLTLYNVLAILGGPALAMLTWALGYRAGLYQTADYWLVFSLPFCYASGVFAAAFTLAPLLDHSNKGWKRFSRSLLGSLRGGALYALLFSALMPVVVMVLFSFSFYFDEISNSVFSSISSVVSIVIGYLAISKKDSGNPTINSYIRRLQPVILAISVLLFVALLFSLIARRMDWPDFQVFGMETYFPAWVLCVSAVLFVVLGIVVNSNRLSLHYFYRDRLSDAYLRTEGRVLRKEGDAQGMPLVELRNDEDLRLSELGCRKNEKGEWETYPKAPYHLIVTALNLNGSSELVRKDLKSDHFVFSRDYIGSNSTGYVRTDVYRGGHTKLARVMTISAAAVGSGMGFSTYFAQSFITTLLNLRLGYWMENPWYYRHDCNKRRVRSGLSGLWMRMGGWQPVKDAKKEKGWRWMSYNPQKNYTFWPLYLMIEMLGLTNADRRLVNLSDGAHTGDNLGLIPLLRRRCRHIVVCDFEEDPTFAFVSLNHAVRMANIEENIDIKIELSPLIPDKIEKGAVHQSQQSVAIGTVSYPDHTRGKIYYLKSSISTAPFQDGKSRTLPLNVFNYHKLYSDFPQQTTADQFFDDPQFEAYRALGFHIAEEASDKILTDLRTWVPEK
ncbi:MAG: hypothetical protein EAZ89_18975 [Bacteroidetes bacterium]|nr:MAG: hypothetical protein EAZ89_18975 [Bacteroidota bacterium]